MKILFLARQLNIGGAERQLVTLANELALVRVVRQERPAVLHGWMHTQNVFATFAWMLNRNVKLFWSVRSARLFPLTLVAKIEERLRTLLSRFPDCIVVNSLAGLEYAASQGIPRAKMVCIPNGIDTALFYPDDALRQRVRGEWGIRDSEKVIGYVARFIPLKNHTLFLKAGAVIAAERPEVRFVCCGHGDPSYLKQVQELSRTLGIESKVRWVEAHPDVTAMYNAFDVFCSSSLTEGFPNVIGEAMACGQALDAGHSLNPRARQRILDNFTVAHLADRTEQALIGSTTGRP